MASLKMLTGADRWFEPERIVTVADTARPDEAEVRGISKKAVRVRHAPADVLGLAGAHHFLAFGQDAKASIWVRVSAVTWVGTPTPPRTDGIRTQVAVGGDEFGVTNEPDDVVAQLKAAGLQL